MLSLTKRERETLVLETSDGSIEIYIREVKGKQVRVNIHAAHEVKIKRKELLDQKPTA